MQRHHLVVLDGEVVPSAFQVRHLRENERTRGAGERGRKKEGRKEGREDERSGGEREEEGRKEGREDERSEGEEGEREGAKICKQAGDRGDGQSVAQMKV